MLWPEERFLATLLSEAGGYARTAPGVQISKYAIAALSHTERLKTRFAMKVYNALTGKLLVELPPASATAAGAQDAAALAYDVPRELVRIVVTECSAIVTRGRIRCCGCRRDIWCSCSPLEYPECTCVVLPDIRRFCCDCTALHTV
jgi:hypothetical protein